MTNGGEDILRWLRTRPLQDNPRRIETAPEETAVSWDEWVNAGRTIPDIDSRLIKVLEQEEDPVIRSSAGLALGFVGGDESIPPLIRALQSDVPLIAMEAAAALGRLRNPEAVESLGDALKNPDSNVRANACTALGLLGGEKARAYLKSAEQDDDSFVRAAAEQALSNLK
jgi:HEAT repeat protein